MAHAGTMLSALAASGGESVVATELELLTVFIIAAVVGIAVAKLGRFPYTIALLLAGVAVSVLGVGIDIELSHDLILLVLLPPLLFEGAATTDLEAFRENAAPIVALAVVGLLGAIGILGYLGWLAFDALVVGGFPLLVALLFAATALPTDPVSVLALFEEAGAPDRLAVLVEGESLIIVAVNRFVAVPVSREYQHVLVWGGLHGSIPIALVLGIPATTAAGAPFPFREELRAMVFGVAGFSLVVQGLTMGRLMDHLGVVTRSEAEELYELLVGRARMVDSALEAAEALADEGRLQGAVLEDVRAEYGREKEHLDDAISELLADNPDIHREELLVGERQVLKREKSAVMDAMRSGVVGDDVGEELLDEVDLKLSRVRDGVSTVRDDPRPGADREAIERYEEFWRRRAREFGLEAAGLEPAADGDGRDS